MRFFPLLFLLFLCSCATLPASPPLPASMTPLPVARGITSTAALSPDARHLLFRSGEEIRVAELDGQTVRTIDTIPSGSTLHAAWSGDGRHLVLTRTSGTKGMIQLWESESGRRLKEWEWNGVLGEGLFLSPSEIIVPAIRLTTYRFGTEVRQVILRMTPESPSPTEEPLHTATLRPSTYARFSSEIQKGFSIKLHPLGDEILYTRFQDPPEFSPYRKVVLRHLSSGQELEAGNIPLDAPPPIFSGVDDEIVTTDGRSIVTIDPWEGKSSLLHPTGGAIAFAPSGNPRIVGGTIIVGGIELTTLPRESTGLFSSDGSVLVVLHGGTAYRIPLPVPANPQTTDGDEAMKLRQLRTLRAKRLITPLDFRRLFPSPGGI